MINATRIFALGLAALAVAGIAVGAVSAAPGLDPAERAALLSMREEEKLAHDVYVTLGARTGLSVFGRIAASETRHEQAVANALARYGVDDPTDGYGVGEFPSARFQQLYDRLVARGSASRAAALAVGVLIEQTDIADLRAAIADSDEARLDQVYGALLAGSTRHLAAFERVSGGAPGR